MSSSAPARGSQPRSELSAALAACRGAFIGTALISGVSNILMLSGAVFMLEVYDRVLPSRSTPTLVGLTILVDRLLEFWMNSDICPSARPAGHCCSIC